MKGHALPVVDNPSNLFKWAKELVAYLRIVERELGTPAPRAVQLEHRKVTARAITDGVIMWCPVTETVIVSKGGQWFGVELGAALPIVGIKDNV